MSPVWAYSNFDGEDEYVEVAAFPDRDAAGHGLAEQSGMIYVFEGRGSIRVQDCECGDPTKDVCPDSDAGSPCLVRDAVDCWHFTSQEASLYGEADLRRDLGDAFDRAHIYRPKTWNPDRPEASREAPTMPLFGVTPTSEPLPSKEPQE